MRDAVRHALAEFIGTFAIVLVSCGAAVASRGLAPGLGLLVVSLAHGLAVAVMVTALMRVAAHFNPAVTMGFLVTRRIEPMMAGVYLTSQLLGAIVAAYVISLTLPADAVDAVRAGGQSVSLDVTGGQALVLEGIALFVLVFVIWGTAVDRQAPNVGGTAIGLAVTALSLALMPFTGASLNPARSVGPAVVTGIYEGQLVYWVGPIVGAILGALVYDFLFTRRAPEPYDHGAVRPKP